MTWEETITMINKDPNYAELVRGAYLSFDLQKNVEDFRSSAEFKETLKLIRSRSPNASSILDVGCGNGISSIAFALEGYQVIGLEPDRSDIVGCGAIQKLIETYHLSNIKIISELAENLNLNNEKIDIVYARQSLHHAMNLNRFVHNISNHLRPGGMWLSVRDHVILNNKDKQWFLESHPLHKYYGGENAFKLNEYKYALKKAGIKISQMYSHYDNVINYSPATETDIQDTIAKRKEIIEKFIARHHLPDLLITRFLVSLLYNYRLGKVNNEKNTPGRLYTFIGFKK